jgi:CRISPR system Cascade subunit CasE
MYLARAFLNPVSRAVRVDLADVASLHRTVMRAFPNQVGPAARHALAVLHRIDEDARRGRFVLLVQSATPPDFTRLPGGYFLDLRDDLDLTLSGAPENPTVRAIDKERERIRAGDRFVFRLRANTTKKVLTKSGPDGAPHNGKRVPVRGDDERLAWLKRRAATAGFRVDDVRVTEERVRSSRGREVTFAGATFDGRLAVIDADAFRGALASGIGPAKAYGFGLLSLARE